MISVLYSFERGSELEYKLVFCKLNLQQDQLVRLLEIATTNQLFQWLFPECLNGQLYQKTDGVAMGSPLGPLMANVFMCHLEEKLTRDGLMPQLYKR